jgi:pimeloyl-ACP methyl ester carboxylesterase
VARILRAADCRSGTGIEALNSFSTLMLDIFGADRLMPLTKLNKPALVIASAESPLLDEEKQMAATIPGAKFVEIAGVGHAVFVDDPASFDTELRKFLAQLSEPTVVH